MQINRDHIPTGNNISMTEPQGCSVGGCDQARHEFYQFVETVYKGLHQIELRVSGSPSPLAMFCRIDIGLIHNSSNNQVLNFIIIPLNTFWYHPVSLFCQWSRVYSSDKFVDKCWFQSQGWCTVCTVMRDIFTSILRLGLEYCSIALGIVDGYMTCYSHSIALGAEGRWKGSAAILPL